MAKPRRSRDEWRQHMAAWSRSGLSSREYARRNGLNPSTFSWWRGELRRQQLQEHGQRLTLVPVTTPAAAPPAEPLEVSLPHGVVIRVPEHVDLVRVATLVRALVGAC